MPVVVHLAHGNAATVALGERVSLTVTDELGATDTKERDADVKM